MRVTIKLFAVLRERAGRAEVGLDVPAGTTAAQAAGKLVEEIPALAGLIGRAAFAVNRGYVKPDAVLCEGDELALIPPVSGG